MPGTAAQTQADPQGGSRTQHRRQRRRARYRRSVTVGHAWWQLNAAQAGAASAALRADGVQLLGAGSWTVGGQPADVESAIRKQMLCLVTGTHGLMRLAKSVHSSSRKYQTSDRHAKYAMKYVCQ